MAAAYLNTTSKWTLGRDASPQTLKIVAKVRKYVKDKPKGVHTAKMMKAFAHILDGVSRTCFAHTYAHTY